MFDIAFSEMVVIAVVALIVIGPEKLPKVARTIGLLVGKLQRYVSAVKADIDRELQYAELQKLQQDIQQSTQRIQSEVAEIKTDLQQVHSETASILAETAQQSESASVLAPEAEKLPDSSPASPSSKPQ